MKKVAIAAGGTGGHFYPGLAVAKELIAEKIHVFFFIKKNDYVKPLLEREGISYREIFSAGFVRAFSIRNVIGFFKLIVGVLESFFSLLRHRPDLLLAMGGYLSFPPVLAAWILRIPILLHEQNARPGLANRWLSWLASAVAVSFPESRSSFRGEVVVTGNPVRPEFANLPPAHAAREKFKLSASKKTILIFGGSLGAHRLNELLVQAFSAVPKLAALWQILHITGKNDEKSMSDAYRSTPWTVCVLPYCHDMASAYAASDFVICRAGASTVFELMAVRKPSLLVPYPYATDNHQRVNAQILENWGVAKVYEQKDLEKGESKEILQDLLESPHEIETMARRFAEAPLDSLKAAERIKTLALGFVNSKNSS